MNVENHPTNEYGRISFGGDASDHVAACPECDSAGQVRKRTQTYNAKGDEPFVCDRCGARFEEYVTRKSRFNPVEASKSAGVSHAGTKALLNADADEYP